MPLRSLPPDADATMCVPSDASNAHASGARLSDGLRDHSDERVSPVPSVHFQGHLLIYVRRTAIRRISIPLRASILKGRIVLFNRLNELNFIRAHVFF